MIRYVCSFGSSPVAHAVSALLHKVIYKYAGPYDILPWTDCVPRVNSNKDVMSSAETCQRMKKKICE